MKMTSNEDPKALEQAESMVIAEIAHGMEKVGKAIDKLSSAGLKRVLKTVSHVHIAENLLGRGNVNLNDNEKDLIDRIFALQESVLGYTQLKRELNEQGEGNERQLDQQLGNDQQEQEGKSLHQD